MAKRRGNNEGSIYRRKDGYWVGQYGVQTAEGTKTRYIYGKRREDVREKLTKAIADRDGGFVFDDKNMDVEEYMKRWLDDSAKGTVRASTYASYEGQVRRYIIPAIGRIKLGKLTPALVQHLYREMQDRGLSTRTVRYTHTVLRRALKQAKRWGMVDRNVAEDVDPPRLKRDEIQPLDREQTRRLLEVAEGDRLHAFYVVAVTAGLRPGEMLALRWSDVDLEVGTLRINRVLSDGEFTTPKTPRSRRKIELSNIARVALRAHRKRQLEWQMKKAGLWKDHGLAFPSTVGTPLSHRNVVRSFKTLLKRADLPAETRLYDLRHTCATLLLNSNVHSLCPTSEGGANFITDGVKGVRDWYVIVDVGARRCTSTLVLDSVEEASKCSPPAQRIRITAACLTPLRTNFREGEVHRSLQRIEKRHGTEQVTVGVLRTSRRSDSRSRMCRARAVRVRFCRD